MPTDLKGWHPGELAMQRKHNFDGAMATAYTWIDCGLPDEHRDFHTTRLPFLPVTTLDDKGRPWGSILAGRAGMPGFIKSPSDTTLELSVRTWEGDPFLDNIKSFKSGGKTLVAGIGIEFPTRRRNKLAGTISKVEQNGFDVALTFTVNQAIGNCPKYINIRNLVPHTPANATVAHSALQLSQSDRLPDEIISFIHASDTVFLGTSYRAPKEIEKKFPSHLGMNQRGGRPGFIRVRPSDGRTLILPDYSGNRLMTSLGNIEVTPLAALTFISFTTGAVLYLTGAAENIIGPAAQRIMPLQNALTTVYVTGYIFVRDALPTRQRPGTTVVRSPYSPPVRFLAEERPASSTTFFDGGDVTVMLTSIQLHSPSLATFAWESSEEILIKPGQAAILDFSLLLGAKEYQHMAPGNPTSVNDDRIRTWTVSDSGAWDYSSDKSDDPKKTRTFALTMRQKPAGMVTGALFSIAWKLCEFRPELLSDTRPLELRVRLAGVSGDFVLSEDDGVGKNSISSNDIVDSAQRTQKLLWMAGGIGLTPFLSMLRAMTKARTPRDSLVDRDIALLLSTREPEVLLPLISRALKKGEGEGGVSVDSGSLKLTLDVFSTTTIPDLEPLNDKSVQVILRRHQGRILHTFFTDSDSSDVGDVAERGAYVCGPEDFEKAMIDALAMVGVQNSQVRRESFTY